MHVAVDGYSRLAYAEALADEKTTTTIGFLGRMRAFYTRHGIEIERIHSDNGSAYKSGQFALALRLAGLGTADQGLTGGRPTARSNA